MPIPPALGQWQTAMLPIPVPESLSGLADDVGGSVGVVTVLMEEDYVTDDGAEAGHNALNAAVRDVINQIVATRNLTNQEVSDEEIAGFEDQISGAVESAVSSQQNVFENIWSWLNADDTIGFKAFIFTHDELADKRTLDFQHRWKNEGDWELFGTITASPICSADALQDLFDELFPAQAGHSDLSSIRNLRDGAFREIAGLNDWWRVLQRNSPAVIQLLRKEPTLRRPALELFTYAKTMAENMDSPLNPEKVVMAASLARSLGLNTRSRRLRIDAQRAADILGTIKAATIQEGLRKLASQKPAR